MLTATTCNDHSSDKKKRLPLVKGDNNQSPPSPPLCWTLVAQPTRIAGTHIRMNFNMPLPKLDSQGFLPEGIHECTFDELRETFGRFSRSDRRQQLTRKLTQYIEELKRANVAVSVIVNGSYVTDKDEPNDIDILVILRDDVRLNEQVPPFEYNARSQRYVRKNYPFDCFFGFANDESASNMVRLFSRCREYPSRSKGIVRVGL